MRVGLFVHVGPVAKALVDAIKRGVDVQVVLNKSQKSEKHTSATLLTNEGVPTFIDSAHARSQTPRCEFLREELGC